MRSLAWQSPSDLRGEAAASVRMGDLVQTGENFHPHYQVIAVTDDRAWIREIQHGSDHVVPIERCQKIPEPAIPQSLLKVLCARNGQGNADDGSRAL